HVEFARTMRRYLAPVDAGFKAIGSAATSAPLARAIDRMEAAAGEFARARNSALTRGISVETQRVTNAALMKVERAMTRPTGLRTRPWYRNLIYVADEDNGYSTMVFPSINEALRSKDAGLAARELEDLVSRFDAATAALKEATRLVQAR
ncbi:MAG: transferrin receptor-like dimerization domain-containing protein, partial [Gemmatimonadota bacterium]